MKKIVFLFLMALVTCIPMLASADSAQHDQKIIGFLETLDRNEIAVSQLALKKDIPQAIKNFAQMMVTEHSHDLQATIKLGQEEKIPALMSARAQHLKMKGQHTLKKLNTLNGKEFSQRYIKVMIHGHRHALRAVNHCLKHVHNLALKKHLEAVQQIIEMHLEKATALKKSLQ